MHSQLLLLALVAPLALSLPQPISQGQSNVLIARQESGNSTRGGDARWHPKHGGRHPERALIEGKGAGNLTEGGHNRLHEYHHGPPHKERDLSERQDSGNSTGAGRGRQDDFKPWKHHGPPHPERDLSERQESSNSTGAGRGGPHHFKPEKHHSAPPHPERDLSERQDSGNSTGSDDDYYHHHNKFGHPGPKKVDKRIKEANGTTPGHVGKDKFTPDGYQGGPQRPGEHKRSIIDTIFDRR